MGLRIKIILSGQTKKRFNRVDWQKFIKTSLVRWVRIRQVYQIGSSWVTKIKIAVYPVLTNAVQLLFLFVFVLFSSVKTFFKKRSIPLLWWFWVKVLDYKNFWNLEASFLPSSMFFFFYNCFGPFVGLLVSILDKAQIHDLMFVISLRL